jgi:hypothetical protein
MPIALIALVLAAFGIGTTGGYSVGHAVLFLIGNGFTTSSVLHVDGGHRLV